MADIDINILANDAKAKPAIERTNTAMERMERIADRAMRAMRSGYEAVTRTVERAAQRVAEFVREHDALRNLAAEVAALAIAHDRHLISVNSVTTAYRAARLVLNPTIFTALSLGAVAAANAAWDVAKAEAALTAQHAEASVLAGKRYDDYRQLALAAELTGRGTDLYEGAAARLDRTLKNASDSALRPFGIDLGEVTLGAKTAGDVLARLGEQAEGLDSFDRARLAVRLFGSDAEKYLPALDGRMARTQRAFEAFGGAVDSVRAREMLRFKQDIDELGDRFGHLRDSAEGAGSGILNAIAYGVAGASNTIAHLNRDFAEIERRGKILTPAERRAEAAAAAENNRTPGEFRGIAEVFNLQAQQRLTPGRSDVGSIGRSELEARAARFEASREGLQKALNSARSAQQKALASVGSDAGKLRSETLLQELAEIEGTITSITQKLAGLDGAKRVLESTRRAQEGLADAVAERAGGAAKAVLEFQKTVQQRTSFVDAEGVQQRFSMTEEAAAATTAELQIRFRAALQADLKSVADAVEEEKRLRLDAAADRMRRELEFGDETRRVESERIGRQVQFEEALIEDGRERALRRAEGFGARTLTQKLDVERRRAEIEEQFEVRSFAAKADRLRRELEIEISNMETIARLRGVSEEQITARRAALANASAERGRSIERESQAKLDDIRESAAQRQARLVIEENQRVFDGLQRSVESLFDSLARDWRSFGDALSGILKTALLAPVKSAVSSYIAGILTPTAAALRGGTGGVGLGALATAGGVLGAPGAPGGTPGFAGPVGGNGANVAGTGLGLAGAKANAVGLLTQLGQIGATNKAFANGVYGAKGGALLAGGGILAFDGLRRGGLTGLLETAAGGALIGAKFGGPIGAAIGAGIGAAAGIVRLFIKGAADKLRDKIRGMYGVEIRDKGTLNNILGMIKNSFGGDMELGVRAPAIRDLIELYAMSTGQKYGGPGGQQAQAIIAQRSGVLSQVQQFGSNGQALASLGGSIGGGVPIVLNVQLDGQATTDVMRGEAVQVVAGNPRLVQSSVGRAASGNYQRRESAARGLAPGLLMG